MKSFKQYLIESNIKDEKIGHSTISYTEHDDHFQIHSLRTPTKYRHQGEGKKCLQHILDKADLAKKPTRLIASPLDKKTHSNKLKAFYYKHGFRDTGEKVNFVGDTWWERPAVN